MRMTYVCLPFSVILLAFGGALGAKLRRRSTMWDCPLCVAEDNCHEACASVREQSPGSRYCLEACTGAHPGDEFGETYFAAADQKMKEAKELDARIKKLGSELAADVAADKAKSAGKS